MFAAKCDRCNAEVMENNEYSCYGDKEMIKDEMRESNWHFSDDDKHYCPDCFTVNDKDEYEILPPINNKQSEFKGKENT